MDKIISIMSAIAAAVTLGAGSYAVIQLGIAAYGLMGSNEQKRESSKDHMKYIVIGLLVAISAGSIVAWLKTF